MIVRKFAHSLPTVEYIAESLSGLKVSFRFWATSWGTDGPLTRHVTALVSYQALRGHHLSLRVVDFQCTALDPYVTRIERMQMGRLVARAVRDYLAAAATGSVPGPARNALSCQGAADRYRKRATQEQPAVKAPSRAARAASWYVAKTDLARAAGESQAALGGQAVADFSTHPGQILANRRQSR